jgi:hypothetical protein
MWKHRLNLDSKVNIMMMTQFQIRTMTIGNAERQEYQI